MAKTPTNRPWTAKEFEASLEEAGKFARGEKAKVKVSVIHLRPQARDVKEARKALKVTQPQFARLLDISTETVRKWEQGINPITGTASRWIAAALKRPKLVKSLLMELTAARA
jgi:putative transcriptional regulator